MRAFAATTKNLVESARVHHNTSPVATAALGRTLTAGAIMGSMMKNDTDMLTLQIRGDGPIEGITVTADSHANVKGYVGNPDVMLPPKNGKLDVGGAVGIGLLVAIFTLGRKLDRHTCLSEMEKGMMSAGIIMLVTGGGGALGQIIKDSGLGNFMAEGLAQTAIPIVVLPLLISTAMRFIQGSGTVAMTTAASISAPIIIASGASPLLGAIACCVGSLFFGYFNDSYFWVVNRTLGVSEAKDQLRVWSVTSTIAWAVGVVEVLVLNIFM